MWKHIRIFNHTPFKWVPLEKDSEFRNCTNSSLSHGGGVVPGGSAVVSITGQAAPYFVRLKFSVGDNSSFVIEILVELDGKVLMEVKPSIKAEHGHSTSENSVFVSSAYLHNKTGMICAYIFMPNTKIDLFYHTRNFSTRYGRLNTATKTYVSQVDTQGISGAIRDKGRFEIEFPPSSKTTTGTMFCRYYNELDLNPAPFFEKLWFDYLTENTTGIDFKDCSVLLGPKRKGAENSDAPFAHVVYEQVANVFGGGVRLDFPYEFSVENMEFIYKPNSGDDFISFRLEDFEPNPKLDA